MAAHAISVIDGYIYGFVQQEVNLLLHTPEQVAEVGEAMLRQLAGEYPHLAEMIADHAMQPGYAYSEEFDFGLDLILDGLERLRPARWCRDDYAPLLREAEPRARPYTPRPWRAGPLRPRGTYLPS
jgi:hypothetical protein